MPVARWIRAAFQAGAAVAVLAATEAARADGGPADGGGAHAPSAPAREVLVRPTVEVSTPAELSGDRGTVSSWRGNLAVEAAVPVNDRLRFQFTFAAEVDDYHFTDPDTIVPGPGRLLDEGIYSRLEPLAKLDLAGGWGIYAGPVVQTAGVPGASFEKTLTWGGQASVRFPVSATTRLVLGVSAETTLEGSWALFPLFDIEGVSTGSIVVGVRGSGVRVGIPVAPCLALGLSARYDRRDWRLAEDDRVPDGVFRDIRIAGGVDLEWRPRPSYAISFGTWWNGYHEIRIDDRHGDHVTSFDAGPSFVFALSASFTF